MGRISRLITLIFLFLCKLFGVLQVLVYLPLSANVGGRNCLEGFSLLLTFLLAGSSAIRWVLRKYNHQGLATFVYFFTQPLVPLLLMISLNEFGRSSSHSIADVLHPTESHTTLLSTVLRKGGAMWGSLLKDLGPLFVILEGACTLLCIQVVSRFTSNKMRRSRYQDVYQVILLIVTSIIYLTSVYSIYRLYRSTTLKPIPATLVGCTLTSIVFLSAIALVGGRGTILDTSLMMAYCCAQIYHVYSPSNRLTTISYLASLLRQPPSAQGPYILPPHWLTSIQSILSVVRNAMGAGYMFMKKALSFIPFDGVVALLYRVFVLYMASCIIIGFKNSFGRPVIRQPRNNNRFFELIYTFNEPILVGSYVHVLLGFGASLTTWKWVNLGLTLSLWCIELVVPSSEIK